MNVKEELRKNLKYIVILIVLLSLYVVLAVFFNSDGNDKQGDGYLIVGESLIYQKVDDNWEQLTEVPDISDLNFTVYDGNNKKENVKVQYNSNMWYFFDDDYNEINYDNFRIAFTNNLDVKINQNTVQRYDNTDEKYISQIIDTNNSESIESYKISLRKLNLDIDNDDEEETLYTMSNYSYEVTDYKQISYLFIVDNGVVKIIDSSEGFEPFVIIDSMDLDGDGKFEVIVAKNVMDVPSFDSCYQIYGVKNGEYTLLKDCKYKNS